MIYRREIDGLRALAVLPVILFHAGLPLFGGGFVGVDVFFVISGYLITTIIALEKQLGRFTLAHFYERRMRRILPPLFLVMLTCLPMAWLWLSPSDMKDFAKSLIAVSSFSSNILFLRESGYFQTATELKPLLHTWSLAVEEQYYVLFPIFLALLWRLGNRQIIFILGMTALISLGLAQWGSINRPDANFYLLPTRAWEILIGALCAFYILAKEKTAESAISKVDIIATEALGFIGIALITYSIFAFDENTPFPSI